jgi:hypothetical protein
MDIALLKKFLDQKKAEQEDQFNNAPALEPDYAPVPREGSLLDTLKRKFGSKEVEPMGLPAPRIRNQRGASVSGVRG